MHELMPDVLEGRIEPGLVFDRTTNIEGIPGGYRAMNDREAIKVKIPDGAQRRADELQR
jgi:threonine dehydrogenase-like Zn-dependent dehydrogenase